MKQKNAGGFTLIELLIVIGVLGILAAVILVAVDPAKRLRQARDARRYSEVNSILNAILNYAVDNRGTLPGSISATSTPRIVGTGLSGCDNVAACPVVLTGATTTAACGNLAADLVDLYISELPIDPRGSHAITAFTYSATATGYYFKRTANGRLEVGSCNPEDAASIKVKR